MKVSQILCAAVLLSVLPHPLHATDTDTQQQLRLIKIEKPFAYYEGNVVVSGLYHEKLRESEIGNFEAGLICFSVKGPTERLIPRDRDPRSPWFCFSNTEKARAALRIPKEVPADTCYVVGTATVQISKYVVDKTDSEVHDTAKLDQVISFSSPTFKTECSLY
jgi:hypothetical protein